MLLSTVPMSKIKSDETKESSIARKNETVSSKDLAHILATLPPVPQSFSIDKAVQQIKTRGFFICDKFLDKTLAAHVAAEAVSKDVALLLQSTGQATDIRTDRCMDVNSLGNSTPAIAKASRLLQFTLAGCISEAIGIPLTCREQPQFAKYQREGYYTKHLDNSLRLNGVDNKRRFTLCYYVHEKWDPCNGGHLRIYAEDTQSPDNVRVFDVTPKPNRLVGFFSETTWHEVRPTQKERMALTVWLSSEDTQKSCKAAHT